MWLVFLLFSIISWIAYRILKFWIFDPWCIHRDLWAQGVPGRHIPIVGELLVVRKAIRTDRPFSHALALADQFGSYYHISFGPIARFDTFDPALINGILKTNARAYHKPYFLHVLLGVLLGSKNLLMAEDEVHAKHRRLIGPVFQQQNINSMTSLVVEITSSLMKKWLAMANEAVHKGNIFTLNIREEMTRLTLDIVMGCVFGTEMVSDEKTHEIVYRNVTETLKLIEKRMFNMTAIIPIINRLPLWGKREIDKYLHEGKEVIQRIVENRKRGLTKSSCKGPDLLDLLLAARDKDETSKFTEDEVYEEALTFVVAGHETTSNLMTWTLYHLANNPDVCRRLQEEVDTVFDDNEEITPSTLSLLTYTESVLKESLRFTSPVPIVGRTAVEDNKLTASDGKEIYIKKGTEIALNLSMFHHSDKYWQEPSKYDPSRFDDKQLDKYLFPFSAGIRSCIGQNFAMFEAKIMLALIIRHFCFELEPGQNHVAEFVITMRPKYGMWMRLSPRIHS